jgi:hypothetical protein
MPPDLQTLTDDLVADSNVSNVPHIQYELPEWENQRFGRMQTKNFTRDWRESKTNLKYVHPAFVNDQPTIEHTDQVIDEIYHLINENIQADLSNRPMMSTADRVKFMTLQRSRVKAINEQIERVVQFPDDIDTFYQQLKENFPPADTLHADYNYDEHFFKFLEQHGSSHTKGRGKQAELSFDGYNPEWSSNYSALPPTTNLTDEQAQHRNIEMGKAIALANINAERKDYPVDKVVMKANENQTRTTTTLETSGNHNTFVEDGRIVYRPYNGKQALTTLSGAMDEEMSELDYEAKMRYLQWLIDNPLPQLDPPH